MGQAAAAAGAPIGIWSPYRPYRQQVQIFNDYVALDGYRDAITYSMRPGHSEHQLGLGVDFMSAGGGSPLPGDWGQTPAGAWMRDNAWKYGWVNSYPLGDNGELFNPRTCFHYEPWHYRYLGRAMARKVSAALGGELRGKIVAVLGLTFKPNTDDMREAPSIPLITALQDMGAKVRAFDPVGMEQAKSVIGNVTFCNDAYSCAEGASALVIVTEWEQFRALDFERLKTVMAQPVLVDLRNVYRPEEIARHGFVYESVGRARK